jgi:putative transposase
VDRGKRGWRLTCRSGRDFTPRRHFLRSRCGRPSQADTPTEAGFTSRSTCRARSGDCCGSSFTADGRGRRLDDAFIERLWRSLKHECVYPHSFENGSEAHAGIGRWVGYHNAERPHSRLGGTTPDETYRGIDAGIGLAA